jgi:hypothetical protein
MEKNDEEERWFIPPHPNPLPQGGEGAIRAIVIVLEYLFAKAMGLCRYRCLGGGGVTDVITGI